MDVRPGPSVALRRLFGSPSGPRLPAAMALSPSVPARRRRAPGPVVGWLEPPASSRWPPATCAACRFGTGGGCCPSLQRHPCLRRCKHQQFVPPRRKDRE
ncbi:hypothetical protein GQ55_6G273100 [Panicum hallii var. hallii]|uniref:Uncharacterized protein n=2 Tax=Panicum hallii TaxID=206008 RepID=A0A2T7DA93_9POAL|nr:hypothetical protein GQ55_6G273100 [Panicum hallii var. hallii]PVH37321.1 hypothetical protein PAHAL_6G287300 [Panicum hallii]